MTRPLITLLACAAAAFAADVKPAATQWMEDLGGSVTRGPQAQITGVNLRGTWVADSDLRRLNDLPDLAALDLSLTHITDQGMQELKGLRGITDLNLYFTEYVTDEGLAAIKEWKKLKRLNLHGTKAGDTALEHISGLTALESLDVGSTLMTDVGLERLTVLPNLHQLTMGGNELADAGLQALRQMPGLTYLDLSGRQGTDKNIWSIAITEGGLDAVLALKNLRELRFGCSAVGVGIEGAKLAEVSRPVITYRWIEKLRALPKLETLKLQGCNRINDDAVTALAALPALKQADLQGTAITEKGAAALRAAKPGIKVYFGPWEGKAAAYRNN